MKIPAIAVAALLMLSSCSTTDEAKVYPPFSDRVVIVGGLLAAGAMALLGK